MRVVVFDLDGTLIDSNTLKRDAFFEACASVPGAGTVLPELIADATDDRFGIIRRLLDRLEPGASQGRYQELVARYSELAETGTASCPEIPGASAVLSSLAHRWPLYVNSATPEYSLQEVIDRRGWSRYFRLVLGRPATKVENLAAICRIEQCPPSGVAFVGDAVSDLEAARQFGCRFIGYGISGDDDDASSASSIGSLMEVEPLLERWIRHA